MCCTPRGRPGRSARDHYSVSVFTIIIIIIIIIINIYDMWKKSFCFLSGVPGEHPPTPQHTAVYIHSSVVRLEDWADNG